MLPRDRRTPQVLLEPRYLEASESLASTLGVQFVPTTATTDVDSLGLPPTVRSAFGSTGLLLHEEQFLPKQGVDPNNLAGVPPGSVDLQWSTDYLSSPGIALTVDHVRDSNLLSLGFHPVRSSRLDTLGVTAFSRSQAGTPPLVTEIFYSVDANATLAVADTGTFEPGQLPSDELALFRAVQKSLHSGPRLQVVIKPRVSFEAGGTSYSLAIDEINRVEPEFMDKALHWTAATTGAQARVDADPLISAVGHTEQQLVTIAGRYPPARTELLGAVGTLVVLNAELSDLARLRTPGASGWLQRYNSDLGRLTAASNRVRAAFGLRAVGT